MNQLFGDGRVAHKSNHPLSMGIGAGILWPFHKFQEVEYIGGLDLIFGGSLIRPDGPMQRRNQRGQDYRGLTNEPPYGRARREKIPARSRQTLTVSYSYP